MHNSASHLSASGFSHRIDSTGRGWKPHLPAHSTGFRSFLLFQQPEKSNETRQQVNIRSTKLSRLEAALFVVDAPVTARKLAEFAQLVDVKECRQLLDELNEIYDKGESTFRIEQVANGYQLMTRTSYAQWLKRLHARDAEQKLSPALMETLTIIAYRQPITRADVESLRGVQSSELLKQLMERGLIRIGGSEDTLGRPFLYETTTKFLQLFGLKHLKELPMSDELIRPAEEEIIAEEEALDEESEEVSAEVEEDETTQSEDLNEESEEESEEDSSAAA